jgi:fatty-acyl-CoA synthase
VVAPAPGAAPSAQEIIDYCRGRLVHYKAPRTVLFVAELPRNAMGKVQKAELRKQFCEQ